MENTTEIREKTPEREEMMTREEVALFFKVCYHTILRWERRGILTPTKFNSRVLRYRRSDVLQLAELGPREVQS